MSALEEHVRRTTSMVMARRMVVREFAATVALARVPWALHYAAPALRDIVTHHHQGAPS